MKRLASNSLLACIMGISIALSKPANSQPRPAAPAQLSDHGQETDLRAEEAKLREAIKRAPNDPSYPARLGSLLVDENRLEEAARYFEKALKLNARDLATRRNLAACYWQMGKLQEARHNLETILKARPDDTWSVLLLGMVAEDLGDHQSAAKLLSGVLPLVRQRPETIDSLARAYYHLGENSKARDTLEMLIGHPAGAEAAFHGGRVAAELGDYETAERMFLSIRSTYSDPGVLNYNLALAQYSARHYAESEKTLQSMIADGHPASDVFALLGRVYGKQGRQKQMLKTFEEAINMNPSNQTYYLDLGEALMEKNNRETAMEVAQETVKRFPSSSRAYSLLGNVELKSYMQADALKSYAKAVELDRDDPKAALGFALAELNANRYADAAKSLEEGARKFSHDAFFQLRYALFLLNAPEEIDAKKLTRIKALLKKSEELDPTIAETHFQLGNLAAREENYGEALNELEIAAREDPESSKVHYVLSRVYRKLERPEDAARETQVYLALKEKEKQNADANTAMGTRQL